MVEFRDHGLITLVASKTTRGKDYIQKSVLNQGSLLL